MSDSALLPTPDAATASHADRQSGGAPQQRRGRSAGVLAGLALIIASYALWRLDTTLDRLNRVGESASRISASQEALRNELSALTSREARNQAAQAERFEQLAGLPTQLERLESTVQELRGRSDAPERAYVKSEVSFLLDAAQRSVAFDADVASAIVALQSGELLLATLKDPELLAVRQQIARELNALRAVPRPDLTTIQLRLASVEEQAGTAPIKGLVVLDRPRLSAAELPQSWWSRGWAVLRQATATLITVRQVDAAASRVVPPAEQLLRRQHLQLLLFSARQAVVRRDVDTYRSSLGIARQWQGELFDLEQPAAEALLDEVVLLEPINIAPAVPDIATSARLLRELDSKSRP